MLTCDAHTLTPSRGYRLRCDVRTPPDLKMRLVFGVKVFKEAVKVTCGLVVGPRPSGPVSFESRTQTCRTRTV